jgi:hypothetical protein
MILSAIKAASSLGSKFFSANLTLLVESLRSRHCEPIIFEIPDIDRAKFRADAGLVTALRSGLYQLLFEHNAEGLVEYRQAGSSALDAPLVGVDAVIGTARSRPDLWANANHLSTKGFALFGAYLADQVALRLREAGTEKGAAQ